MGYHSLSMSLLDDLRAVAADLDPQFQVTSNEVAGVLSALVYYSEHGAELVTAAKDGGTAAVTELLSPAPAPTEGDTSPSTHGTSSASPAPADLSDDELARQIADYQAQLAARQATAQQTQVEHQAGVPADPAPAAD